MTRIIYRFNEWFQFSDLADTSNKYIVSGSYCQRFGWLLLYIIKLALFVVLSNLSVFHFIYFYSFFLYFFLIFVSLVTFLQVTDPVRMQGGENLNLFTFKLSWIINCSSIYLSIVGGSKHLISWNSSHSSTRGGFLPPVASGPVSPFSGATSLPVSRIHSLISAAFAALLIWPLKRQWELLWTTSCKCESSTTFYIAVESEITYKLENRSMVGCILDVFFFPFTNFAFAQQGFLFSFFFLNFCLCLHTLCSMYFRSHCDL